jgi:hypothetical protein
MEKTLVLHGIIIPPPSLNCLSEPVGTSDPTDLSRRSPDCKGIQAIVGNHRGLWVSRLGFRAWGFALEVLPLAFYSAQPECKNAKF